MIFLFYFMDFLFNTVNSTFDELGCNKILLLSSPPKKICCICMSQTFIYQECFLKCIHSFRSIHHRRILCLHALIRQFSRKRRTNQRTDWQTDPLIKMQGDFLAIYFIKNVQIFYKENAQRTFRYFMLRERSDILYRECFMNCLTNKLGYAKPQMRSTPLGTPFAPATPHITHFSLPSPSPRLPKSKRAFSRI